MFTWPPVFSNQGITAGSFSATYELKAYLWRSVTQHVRLHAQIDLVIHVGDLSQQAVADTEEGVVTMQGAIACDLHRALAELGFDLTLMVQGPPDKAPKFQAMFDRRGVEHPFEVFPEPWNLSEHLGGGRFDVAYLADHCRGECRKAGVPMIVSRELEPYYSGVGSNLEHLDRLLRQTLSSRSGS